MELYSMKFFSVTLIYIVMCGSNVHFYYCIGFHCMNMQQYSYLLFKGILIVSSFQLL